MNYQLYVLPTTQAFGCVHGSLPPQVLPMFPPYAIRRIMIVAFRSTGTRYRMAPGMKKKALERREAVAKRKAKLTHAQRQERFQQLKNERLQREREAYENLTPEQKRRRDLRDEKRAKKASANKKLKVKSSWHKWSGSLRFQARLPNLPLFPPPSYLAVMVRRSGRLSQVSGRCDLIPCCGFRVGLA